MLDTNSDTLCYQHFKYLAIDLETSRPVVYALSNYACLILTAAAAQYDICFMRAAENPQHASYLLLLQTEHDAAIG